MAGLLDYINRGGRALQTLMEGIATPQVAADPAMMEMLTPEQRAAAMKHARIAGAAAMQEGADKGLPWYALGTARDFKAQPAYNGFIADATASVEELRKRRENDGRRQKVAELVARLSNPDDPLTKQYTPEQIAVLGALDPDAQAAMLAKSAFPKESGINVATAGTVQGGRFKLPNGNIGAMVQTGDPNNPVRIVDTGEQYVSEMPSDIRSLEAIANNPELLRIILERSKADKTGTDTGAANVAILKEVPAVIATNDRHITALQELEAKIAALPTGPISGRTLQVLSSDFQVAQALMYEEALLQIGALKAAGASLNPITEKELEVLFTTSPKLTNNAEANIKIIRARIQKIQRLNADLMAQVEAARTGDVTRYDPRASTLPASPVPTSNVPPPAPQVSAPPGAPGSGVSTIPTIRRPGQ